MLTAGFWDWSENIRQRKTLGCTVTPRGRHGGVPLLTIYGPGNEAVKQSLQITLDAATNAGLNMDELELPGL